ncbi:RING finger domain-containing protein [Cryptosporidium canis]|uniref:RING finger domain-containing protein n=1 Tax=Cryptosporidium canis TaxID=195482 RepID=A0ABQ8P9W8_9CRYT|nr:RING finger domain-containing protein [Cryptosporidium canis]
MSKSRENANKISYVLLIKIATVSGVVTEREANLLWWVESDEMLYEIRVENGISDHLECEVSDEPELFSYEFYAELFELLLCYDVTAISIGGTLIAITTLGNEVVVFKKNRGFDKVGVTRVYLKGREEIFRSISLDEKRGMLHSLSNKDEYSIYKINFTLEKMEASEICREVGVISFFLNESVGCVLLILKSGRCKVLSMDDETEGRTRIILTHERIIKNCKMSAIWYSAKIILWNIGHKLYMYDYSSDRLILNINLRNYITVDENVSMNKALVHLCEGNIYILVKNKVFLFNLLKDGQGDYMFNFKLIYKLDEVYSAIDVSNIEIRPLNLVYTCIMAILSSSKDQINIFIFDPFFRIIRHDIVHCKKHLLRDLRRYKYLSESDYVNLEHLQSVPRFLKYSGSQLLIHKNRNQSFLRMESIGIDELFISCMSKPVDHSLFLMNCDISKEMETCIMVKYVQRNSNSFELIDRAISKRSTELDSIEELDLYIDLFSYFDNFSGFIRYFKDSDSFLQLFSEIKDLQWHFNFLSMLYKRDVTLFYYAINSLPVRKMIMELDWNHKIYFGLLYFMETNTSVDLKGFGYGDCNQGASCNYQFQSSNDKKAVFYYLSYFQVLSWMKVSCEQTMVNCLHLIKKFPENETVQDSILSYFGIYSTEFPGKVKKFVFENSSCVLNTDNKSIIGVIICNNIIGEYKHFYEYIKDRKSDCYLFLKTLLFYQRNYKDLSSVSISSDYQIKICSEELVDLMSAHLKHIVQIYLEFSTHQLLSFINTNSGLFSSPNWQYLSELDLSGNYGNEANSDKRYLVEVKSMAMFLLNKKSDALKLLLDNELVFSCLSLVLYLSSDDKAIWRQLFDMISNTGDMESENLNNFVYWYEYLVCNPTNKSPESFTLNILSRFAFPKNPLFFNLIRKGSFKDPNQKMDCCNFHSIPFNEKYLTPEIRRLLSDCMSTFNIGTENCPPETNRIHEKYLKLQIELACANLDYFNHEISRNIEECVETLPQASCINYNSDLCSLCNSKLFFLENRKLSNKVILNHCRHNYHYECYLKHVHINNKSHKFKAGVENNLSKNNIKCIICQYKSTINCQF